MRTSVPFKRSLGAVSHAWLACSLLGAAACILAGCGGESAAGAPDRDLEESALVATWSMTQNSPVGVVVVSMEVNADHTLLVTVTAPAGTGAADLIETQREKMTWSLAAGNLMSNVKTQCHYSDGAGGLLEQACKVPTSETVPVAVSGKSLTLVRGDLSYVFTRP